MSISSVSTTKPPLAPPMDPAALKLSTTGPKKLAEDIYLVAGWSVSNQLDGNALLIKGKHPVLIDMGSKIGYEALKRNVESLGYKVSDISMVLATHGHWDHLSGMARLREESRAKLYVHAKDKAAVESGDAFDTATFLYSGQSYTPTKVDGELYDGQRLRAGKHWIQVVHTPGHTPGSVSFILHVNGKKLAVVGDAVKADFNLRQSNLDDWINSLNKLVDLKPDLILGGHTEERLMDRATERLQEAVTELQSGYARVFFVTPGRKPEISF